MKKKEPEIDAIDITFKMHLKFVTPAGESTHWGSLTQTNVLLEE